MVPSRAARSTSRGRRRTADVTPHGDSGGRQRRRRVSAPPAFSSSSRRAAQSTSSLPRGCVSPSSIRDSARQPSVLTGSQNSSCYRAYSYFQDRRSQRNNMGPPPADADLSDDDFNNGGALNSQSSQERRNSQNAAAAADAADQANDAYGGDGGDADLSDEDFADLWDGGTDMDWSHDFDEGLLGKLAAHKQAFYGLQQGMANQFPGNEIDN